ncbi:MAG: hypothetical protein V1872_00135 [bacterium]
MTKEKLEEIRERFRQGDYSVSDHAIIEARKDGIEPQTVTNLEWVAIHGKVIEEYLDRQRSLVYANLSKEELPIHIRHLSKINPCYGKL